MSRTNKIMDRVLGELMVLPGFPGYCVTRGTLNHIAYKSGIFNRDQKKEKEWYQGYAREAPPEYFKIGYDEAIELYKQVGAI